MGFYNTLQPDRKKQIFTVFNVMPEEIKEAPKREQKLSGLQAVYGFCIEEGVEDIELLEAEQIRRFESYLDKQTKNSLRKELLRPSLEFGLRTLFLRSEEINWNANVWYLERLRLQQNRINSSRMIDRISFREISVPCNRQFLKDYMKYQFGISSQAVGTVHRKYNVLVKMLVWFDSQSLDVSRCTAEQIEAYIRTLEERDISAETFNDYLSAIHQFFCFLVVKGYMERVPFRIEYYEKK